jgi:hypothetical protein
MYSCQQSDFTHKYGTSYEEAEADDQEEREKGT